jgi:hypothetical protein
MLRIERLLTHAWLCCFAHMAALAYPLTDVAQAADLGRDGT